MAALMPLLVTPRGQSFELWWLPTVCIVVPVTIWGIYLTALNGFFIFISNVATSSEGPGWSVCQCCLVGLDEIVQVSWVGQSHQLIFNLLFFSLGISPFYLLFTLFKGIYLVSVTKSGCLTVHDFEALYCHGNESLPKWVPALQLAILFLSLGKYLVLSFD